jgi:predicted transposase YdaD
MHEYDTSSKYMIQRHGDSILRMAGARNIASREPLQAELVKHRRLPDGLIEVWHHREQKPDPYLIEIATYPEARVADQVADDITLFRLANHTLPEVVVVFLRPRGKIEAVDSMRARSRHGFTACDLSWRVVKLWEVPAEELLAAGDIGLVPWVPLARSSEPPERVIRQCRTRIDRQAPPSERADLLVVTQFLTRLRYNDPGLVQILGGRKAMIESPLYQELKEELTREAARAASRETAIENLMTFLTGRFGARAEALKTELSAIDDQALLRELVGHAATCRSLASFRKKLAN